MATTDNILIAYVKLFMSIKYIRNPIKNYWSFIYKCFL